MKISIVILLALLAGCTTTNTTDARANEYTFDTIDAIASLFFKPGLYQYGIDECLAGNEKACNAVLFTRSTVKTCKALWPDDAAALTDCIILLHHSESSVSI